MLQRSTGSAEVIESLQYWLNRAREGDIYFAALAVVKDQDQFCCEHVGARGLETSALRGVGMLKHELELLVEARRLGPRNLSLDASYVEWPCTGTPVNWDFLIWLVNAEMTRRRKGAPPPLRVHFSRVEQLDERSRSFFEHVFRPLLPLIGAYEEVGAEGGRHNPSYVPFEIVLAAKAGEAVPILQAPDQDRDTMRLWLHGTRPITVTLRESSVWKKRNSNLEAWLHWAHDRQQEGEEVIFVRDTERATEPLPGFCTCPLASWSVPVRMALYEAAKINMFVSNGPAGLGLFSKVPYLYFVNIRRDVDYAPNRAGWWVESNGLDEGEQWPWARPDQRMIWKTDTYEHISEAWEEYRGAVPRRVCMAEE